MKKMLHFLLISLCLVTFSILADEKPSKDDSQPTPTEPSKGVEVTPAPPVEKVPSEINWLHDYDEGLKQAKEKNTFVMLYFGASW